MIQNRQFPQFIHKLVEKNNREEIYDVWLHRVYDKVFDDFYQEILDRAKLKHQKVDIKEAIETSNQVLQLITPKGGE
jgi:hypothetical protein